MIAPDFAPGVGYALQLLDLEAQAEGDRLRLRFFKSENGRQRGKLLLHVLLDGGGLTTLAEAASQALDASDEPHVYLPYPNPRAAEDLDQGWF